MSAEAALPAYLRETADGCTIAIRVQPGTKRTAIVGIYGEGGSAQLKIMLQAPPVDGRANEALMALAVGLTGLSKSSIEIISGQTSRSEVLKLAGLKPSDCLQVISSLAV